MKKHAPEEILQKKFRLSKTRFPDQLGFFILFILSDV